jgi:ribose transport system permease protein
LTQLPTDARSTGEPARNSAGTIAETGSSRFRPGRSLPELAALLVVLLLLLIFFAWRSPFFLNVDNFLNILTAIAVTGVIAVPGTMLMISAQVDLSVGSAAAFCGVVLAVIADSAGLGVGVLAALGAGLLLGVVNGFLVTVIKVNALITTLGTLAVLRGLTQLTADGQTVLMAGGFGWLGTARPLGVPLPVVILATVVVAAFVTMRYTVFGRSLYAIGANSSAARLVGIRARGTVFIAFVLSGLAACVGGLILTSQLSAASPIAASGLELSVIAAIVLGGASLSGGRGTIGGTIVGLAIIGVLNNGLILLNVNTFWQDVARGTLLILAVSFDQLRQRLQPVGR